MFCLFCFIACPTANSHYYIHVVVNLDHSKSSLTGTYVHTCGGDSGDRGDRGRLPIPFTSGFLAELVNFLGDLMGGRKRGGWNWDSQNGENLEK